MKRLIWIVLIGILLSPAIARAQSEEVVYYHTDAIGSVRMVTNESGVSLGRYDYTPFGQQWEVPPTNPDVRQFAGKELDATGLNYFGARYFDSQIGRFTTVDPALDAKKALVEPQLWNRYSYVTNNPFRFIDPNGRQREVLDQDIRALLAKQITVEEYNARIQARGVGAALGGLIVAGPIAWRAAFSCLYSRACQSTVINLGEDLANAPTPTQFAGKAAARESLSHLGDVGAAANRFFRDATSKSTDFMVTELAGGLRRLEFFSPARNAGYGKRYIQEIDGFGRVVREYKETIGPDGIIEVKWVHGGPGQ